MTRHGASSTSSMGEAEDQLKLGFPQFKRLVEERLEAAALDVWDGDLKNHTFRMSLASALQHLDVVSEWRNEAGEPLSVLPGYVDRMRPNAVADRDGATHVVGMYTPLFAAVNEFAMFCFTQRGFFADVGDPSREAPPPPPDGHVPGLWLLRHTLAGGKVEDHHSAELTPKDPQRYNASLYLGYLMARFVWFHEYAHCFNGHVAYVQNTGFALRLYEVSETPITSSSVGSTDPRDDELRSLELDADEAALWASWQVQATEQENFESFAPLAQDLRKRLTLFGAYAMTWLFEEFQNFMESRGGHTHPAPYLRLQNMLHLARQRFTSRGDRELQERVWKEFDHIACAVPNMYRSDNLTRDVSDPALLSELVRLLQRLEELRPALAQFRYSAPGATS